MRELPNYDALPLAPNGGRSGWGFFGSEDNVGLLNLQTAEGVVNAARLIRKGSLFPLDAAINAFSPSLVASRGMPRHRIFHDGSHLFFDDVYDNFYPQVSSQWDSLGHAGYSPGCFYNGASGDDVRSGRRNTIDHWARRGIAGRAVVLDMPRALAEAGRPYDPGTSTAFSVADVELARRRAGVDWQAGDVLLLHTGFAAWFLQQDRQARTQFTQEQVTAPGLAQGEDMCRYLWDSHIAAVASDTFAVEVMPPDYSRASASLSMHQMLIGQFGMALGELWWTEDLADDCAADRVYEVFLCSMPLNAPGALGSPANAIAIK
jgi:kynurenine formamidase